MPGLLAEHRGVRHLRHQPPFSEEQILEWADAYFQRTGKWPTRRSGAVTEGSADNWQNVHDALAYGRRGLSGGSTLPLFLAERRGVRNVWTRPNLSLAQILAWADAHHERNGTWPTTDSDPVAEAREETWTAIDLALRKGQRGLPGAWSLAKLLAAERGVRNHKGLPRLRVTRILTWADAQRRRTGEWPMNHSGPVTEAPEET